MLKLAGYTALKEIHSGKKSLVYRGERSSQPVIVKILNRDYPEPHELNRFKHEFDILQNLKVTGIPRPLAFEKYNNSVALVLEDMGGDALSFTYKDNDSYSLLEFLNIALKASKVLERIHKANIVHNDIKAQNIVINQKTGELCIIDFGSSTFLAQRNSFIPLNQSFHGTLAHISPEQTGRMNRTVDYRTDFYSLGITFYQMMTGELPFQYADPMEMVHAHIAKTPVSPYEKNQSPKVISNIIMKLLEKNPEDRYQTVTGLVYDLEQVERVLRHEGIRSVQKLEMVVASKDHSGKFQIPKKLYGREKEVTRIIDTFHNVARGNLELILIAGRSGIGKSVLINEVNKPIAEYKGYFSSGKYDQLKRSIPYRAITQSFQKLIQQILAESQDSISLWKEHILKALGPNGRVIVDVIPELGTLIGEQPEIASLDASESQNRFNFVFQNFIKACSREEHPIAIFLDDLQWADTPSINLIRAILSDPEMKHLFLMLSYRDNEVLPTDPFSILLDDLKGTGFYHQKINLNPLGIQDINSLVSETLFCKKDESLSLAEILHSKTKGNPFYVNEVFKSLYDKELIVYKDDRWVWDIQKIRDVNISGNVIDLIVEKIKELPESRIETLKLAACIGSWFKQEVYASIAEKSLEEVKEDLIELANDEFFLLSETDVNFVHDKIQEAAYSIIPEKEREKIHYHIGNSYLRMIDEYRLEDHIFTIVNQLNQGIANIITTEERLRLQELNVMAGNKSLASSAYEAALGFFQVAVEFLPENSWESRYDSTLKLYTNQAEAEYLSKEYDAAEKTFDIISANAKDTLDKIQIFELKSSMYVSQNRMLDVLVILKQALKLLGLNLPKNPGELSPLPDIIGFKLKLGKRAISDLANLPISHDRNYLAIMRLLNACIAASFLAQPALFPVIVLKMVRLTLKHGLSPLSPFGFVAFGMIQGFGLGDFEAGYEFGKLAVDSIDKLDAKAFKCRTLFLFGCMISHWKFHAKEGIAIFQESFQSGMETGDLQYAAYSLNNIHFQALLRRQNLDELANSFDKFESSLFSLKQSNAYQVFQLNRQVTSILRGNSENLLALDGNYFSESVIAVEWQTLKNANALFDYYLCKARLDYLFGDLEKAYEYYLLGEPFEGAMFGMMFIPELVFFGSLISASLLKTTDNKAKKKEYKKRIDKNQKRLKKWAESSPYNYGHKFHIMEGLISEIEGNTKKALSYWKKAIALALENDYTLEGAIANEFSARILLSQGESMYANVHLVEAHHLYRKWGCDPKVKELEGKYSFLKKYSKRSVNDPMETFTLTSTTKEVTSTSDSYFDLHTVIKASHTISGEIQLGRLLEKMIKILLENAGAERGFFILKDESNWLIQAEGKSSTGQIEVLQAKTLDSLQSNQTDVSQLELSPNIVNYVIRTKSVVILNDASHEGMFVTDFYIKSKSPKSILCYPIINHGNLVGIVYLENNLTTDAFTPDRIEILKLLSSQIAVSIENSILYANLEDKVKERTQDLNDALTEVRGLKEQQDGDYFLTSLLIEPLAQNHVASQAVYVDFLIEQKKKFQFKDWKSEIGGDLCVAANLELRDRKYTVVLNGDAMGKSIQGAGGALVLGSVFEAILKRGKDTAENRNLFPERWLKNAFIELHHTFTTFDGSMLVSIFLCLIDEETGFLYFMNAEHPRPVIYRDGHADFLPHNLFYAKLGMLLTKKRKKKMQISTYQLQKDDVMIIGSDGRDDLYLGTEDGYDKINEDEELFLRTVEEDQGNIRSIQESIKTNGQLIDDLSLIRVEFKGQPDQTNYQSSNHTHSAYETAVSEFEAGDYQRALFYAIPYSDSNPSNEECLFLISSCYLHLNQLPFAIDYAERLRLRIPDHDNNLKQLLFMYKEVGNFEMADKLSQN
ncbi:AAA family ATPase [Leptospira ilyithenensis]|uniref:GAF domain-containing protein n=1 Tax=Leptospira ilyithenensis TaxID=2484901 RepID=A0A4R9LRF7_9LEPT|nr:AAA family ATPase [Leptospira ilyithenensis]TGN10570.1 GAF domain-containing protein [Leptospira ilyithenensis]